MSDVAGISESLLDEIYAHLPLTVLAGIYVRPDGVTDILADDDA